MKRSLCLPDPGRPWRRREFLRLGGLAALAAAPFLDAAQGAGGASYDAVIVGGGIAGLTAAYYLRELRILVLEKEARTGGRIRREPGPGGAVSQATYIGKPYGALKEIIEALGLEPLEIPAPMESAFQDEQFYFGADGLAGFFGERSRPADFERFKSEVLEAAGDYQDIPELDFTPRQAKLDDLTARQWFVERKFPPVFQEYYDRAIRGRFGASLEDVSALGVIPEIAFRLGGATGDVAAPETGTGAFAFEGGLSAITEALAGRLGEKILSRARVIRVSKPKADYLVEYADAAGRIRSVRAKFVILAVPAPAALSIGGSILKSEARSLLESIAYSSCAAVALTTREPLFGRAFDLSLPDGGIAADLRDADWIFRTREAGRSGPRSAGVVIRAVPARLGDPAWPALTDDDIAAAAVRAASRIFPGLPARLTGRQVIRFPQAYPVMIPGAFRRLTRLNEISDGRVLLAGDHMIYPDFEAAADSGDFAAEKVGELF